MAFSRREPKEPKRPPSALLGAGLEAGSAAETLSSPKALSNCCCAALTAAAEACSLSFAPSKKSSSSS